MARLSRTDVAERMGRLPGWALDGDEIRKEFAFGSFADAIAFVNRLAPVADAMDHHPDIVVRYTRVTLTYSTHSEGGLTTRDFEAAAAADRLA